MITKTRIVCLILLLSIAYQSNAQRILSGNLVPNYSFEQYTSCPNAFFSITLATPWDPARGNMDMGSTDYINTCSSYFEITNVLIHNLPLSGNACAGIVPYGNHLNGLYDNYREYLEVKLKSYFIKNKEYCFNLNTILSKYGNIKIENIGILVTPNYVNSYNPLAHGVMLIDSIPQIINTKGIISDSTNWTKISGIYKAKGSEEYITIGNFKDDNHTNWIAMDNSPVYAYYLIDDVSVCECSFDINLGEDTKLCEGDKIILNPKLPNANYTWQDSSHAATYEVKEPVTYWVHAYIADYDITTSDTIVITAEDEKICNPPLTIPNFITPNGDNVNDNFQIGNADKYDISLQIYNRWGTLIYQTAHYTNDYNCHGCADGVYYYLLTAKSLRSGKVKDYKGSLTVFN